MEDEGKVPPLAQTSKREVPSRATLRLIQTQIPTQIGWGVLALVLFLGLVFSLDRTLKELLLPASAWKSTPGQVLSLEQMNMRVNTDMVQRATLAYSVDGKEIQGFCYGSLRDFPESLPAPAEIFYLESNPSLARTKNSRIGPAPPFVARILVAFLLPGLVLVGFGVLQGRKKARILAQGIWAKGEVLSKSPTTSRRNGRPVLELRVGFPTAAGSKAECSTRTHLPEAFEPEPELLYLEDSPSQAVLLASLPKGVAFDRGSSQVQVRAGSWLPYLSAGIVFFLELPIWILRCLG